MVNTIDAFRVRRYVAQFWEALNGADQREHFVRVLESDYDALALNDLDDFAAVICECLRFCCCELKHGRFLVVRECAWSMGVVSGIPVGYVKELAGRAVKPSNDAGLGIRAFLQALRIAPELRALCRLADPRGDRSARRVAEILGALSPSVDRPRREVSQVFVVWSEVPELVDQMPDLCRRELVNGEDAVGVAIVVSVDQYRFPGRQQERLVVGRHFNPAMLVLVF